MRLGNLDALKEDLRQYFPDEVLDGISARSVFNQILHDIDNAPTVDIKDIYQEGHYYGHLEGYTKAINEERPQGECKDCDNCEDKALSYSMGFKDGYRIGGFEFVLLKRWLIAQGYSEGTVDDKINEFTRFVEKIRGEE